jgi:hypothetical protein
MNLVDEPLVHLPDERLRPPAGAMETILARWR